MALILARSPYFVNKGNLEDATLDIEVGYIDSAGNQITLTTYSLVFLGQSNLDISPFIRDYFDDYEIVTVVTKLNGNISDVAQTEVVVNYLAVDGYSYFEEGYNLDKSGDLESNLFYAGSNTLIYRYSNTGLSLPFICAKVDAPYDVTVSYYEGDTLFYSQAVDFTNNNQTSIKVQYVTDYIVYNLGDGSGNDIEDGGGLILQVAEEISENASAYVTKVVVGDGNGNSKEFTVVTIDKCKYEPYKIVFRNKLGVYEDIWFFKKSTLNINVSKESFRPNIVDDFSNGKLTHQNKNFNVNGRENMVLNTGFLPESYAENMKQLLLSESAFIYKDGIKRPITITTSGLEFKSHVNDKLINYTLEIEFANDVINNVG